MATVSRALGFLVLCAGFFTAKALSGGTTALPCDFKGMATVVHPANDVIMCNGIIISGELLLPELCGIALVQMNQATDISIRYADGNENFDILINTLSGAALSGVFRITLQNFGTGTGCFQDAILYDPATMSLDFSTCQLASYGGGLNQATVFDSTAFNTVSLTKSTSAPCCSVVRDSMTTNQIGIIIDQAAPYNCLTASGSACGLGDLGAPVYCNDTISGESVVTALTSSVPCENNQPFLAHDLTNEDPDFTFGIVV